jgi:hypothetical protein
MALLSGITNTVPQNEALVLYHYIMVFQLIEYGIPWDAIHTMTENEINIILGVAAAMKQKEQEAQARQQASQMRGM